MSNILNITNVQIKKLIREITPKDGEPAPKSLKRAIVSVSYCGGEVVTHNIEVWEGAKGLYIQFPTTKRFIINKEHEKEEIVYNVTHPTSSAARKEFEDAVLTAYKAKRDATG